MSYIKKRGKNSTSKRKILKNLVADVILYEKIETNLPTAHALTKLLAKLIKWGKKNDLHSRRLSLRYLVNKKKTEIIRGGKKIKLFDKLFNELAIRYSARNSGYSRIIKLGHRIGDNTTRVLFSLV